ncbi:MAG: sigma-70 family RNA polymerase sigma factor [bacterium]|nr:sigma-70 family RNA polymerase sigma factor [bacterium]
MDDLSGKTYQENDTLLAQYRAASSEREHTRVRDQLVAANMGLVSMCARRIQLRSPRTPLEDLMQEGIFGLLRAIEHFDPSLNLQFSTFAGTCIENAIKSAIDTTLANTAQYGVRQLSHRHLRYVYVSTEAFRLLNGRVPDTDELVNELRVCPFSEAQRMTRNQVEWCIDFLSRRDVSLDAPVYSGEGKPVSRHERFADESVDIEVANDARRALDAVERAVRRIAGAFTLLRERDANIIKLYFGLGDEAPLTLEVIGQGYDLSRERIRQCVVNVFSFLKEHGVDIDDDRFRSLVQIRENLRSLVASFGNSDDVREAASPLQTGSGSAELDAFITSLESIASAPISGTRRLTKVKKVVYRPPLVALGLDEMFTILCEHHVERPSGARYIQVPIKVLNLRVGLARVHAEEVLAEFERQGKIALEEEKSLARLLVDPTIHKVHEPSRLPAPHHKQKPPRRPPVPRPKPLVVVQERRLDEVYHLLRGRASAVDGRYVLRGAMPLLATLFGNDFAFAQRILLLLERSWHIRQLDGWRAVELKHRGFSHEVIIRSFDLWASAGYWSRCLPVSASTIRKRACASDRIRALERGRDPWGSPYLFYALSDIERECADLIDAPFGSVVGLLELDGERYATCSALVWELTRRTSCFLGISTIRRFVQEQEDIRTFEGRSSQGNTVTFYHVEDVLAAYEIAETTERLAVL